MCLEIEAASEVRETGRQRVVLCRGENGKGQERQWGWQEPAPAPLAVIAELVSQVTDATTGQAFAVRSIQVFRIRAGKILLFRDYFNPTGLAEALGG